jgi:tRNA nucleotidyltransferase (CCA-adding enzyme)
MTRKEAARRRDFTMNAMSMDIEGNIYDPFGGIQDIEDKIIRHTSEQFSEDPLRALRGMQFAARFGFTMAKETCEICREMMI